MLNIDYYVLFIKMKTVIFKEYTKMPDLDIEHFRKDEETAHEDRCFSKNTKQVALGIRMSGECVFAELREEGEPWGYTPAERRLELNKRYNEKAIKIIGRPLLSENLPEPNDSHFPEFRQIGEVFGDRYVFDGKTTWLEGSLSTARELEAPFTFMSNDEDRIIAEVRRDCEAAKVDDIRGLNLSTAGSINNGSLLTSMRTVMAAIQNYGRY